jgi:hypothetical protein
MRGADEARLALRIMQSTHAHLQLGYAVNARLLASQPFADNYFQTTPAAGHCMSRPITSVGGFEFAISILM